MIQDDQKKFIGYNNSIANSNNTSFLNRSFEKEETSTKLARVMVIGEILAGKKTFVNSMFMVKSNKKNAILKNST